MYSRELIESLLKATDIVTVISSFIPVEKKGRNYVALCPFHDDKNPSLSISKEKQIFKCFVCGTGGDAIGFVQKYLKIPYPEAVRKGAEISNFHDPRLTEDAPKIKIDPEKQRLYSCIDDLLTLYKYALSTDEAAKARNYLDSRDLKDDIVSTFQIGYAPLDGVKTVQYLRAKGHSLKDIENIGIARAKAEGSSDNNAGRIIFPLFNPRGQLVGFSARQIEKDGTAKYINSPETPIFTKGTNLYNYHRVSVSAKRDGYCYLMEGFMDVMSAYKAGVTNAVALMGTSLTPEQVDLLKKLRCEIRLCLDGDEPGQKAMMKASFLLTKAGIPHRVVDYQGDLRDPDDVYTQDGKDALLARLNNLLDPMDFYLGFYKASLGSRSQEQRKQILLFFLPYLKSQKPGIEFEDALVKLSSATGYATEAIRTMVGQSRGDDPSEEEQNITFAKVKAKMGQKQLSRLQQAEKNLLYYMLKDPRAIEIYQSRVGSFYDETYRMAANYVLEYAHSHPGENIDVSLVCASSNMDGLDEVSASLTDLALESTHEPSTEELLLRYATTIAEEKSSTSVRNEMEQSLLQGDEIASKAALEAFLEERRKKLTKK